MLTLPVCSWIKQQFPSAKVIFLGKGYTRPVVNAYQDVDEYLDWNDYENLEKSKQVEAFRAIGADVIVHVFPRKELAKLAKAAKIPTRIGTSHRAYHLLTCNYRPSFTRKKSPYHEAQLNHELLRPFGLETLPSMEALAECTVSFNVPNVKLPEDLNAIVSDANKVTILHPKSQGSAKEWPLESYLELTKKLINLGHTVLFTGTEKEGAMFRSELPKHDQVIDTTGRLSLEQLIVLISKANNLVACSTGPLHIAGFLGIRTIGFFSPRKPIHPGRWRALGKDVRILVDDPNCEACGRKEDCNCITQIAPERVIAEIA